MVSKVKARSFHGEDLFFFVRLLSDRLTVALDRSAWFQLGVTAARLYQTAIQGRSLPAHFSERATAGSCARRLRNSHVPRVGNSNRQLTLRETGSLGSSSTRGQPRDRVASSDLRWIQPSRTGGQSKQGGREQGRTGAYRDQCPKRWVFRSTLLGARPRLPQFGLQLPGTVGVAWSWLRPGCQTRQLSLGVRPLVPAWLIGYNSRGCQSARVGGVARKVGSRFAAARN